MSDKAIYDAFATMVSAFAAEFSPPLEVGFPGVAFTPPTAGTWLEVRWFQNQTQNYGLADDAASLKQGFGQVSVCYRPAPGLNDGLDLCDQVIAAFPKGTMWDGVRVYQKPWASTPVPQPERMEHPITIPWRGFDA